MVNLSLSHTHTHGHNTRELPAHIPKLPDIHPAENIIRSLAAFPIFQRSGTFGSLLLLGDQMFGIQNFNKIGLVPVWSNRVQ